MEPTESGTVLYCYAGHSIFGKIDIAMLSDTYDVRVAHFDIKQTFQEKIRSFMRYNLSVTRKIFDSKTVIINFGSWHTIWPVMMAKLLRKKSIILIGGFDAMSVPSLEYGVFYKKNILQRLLRMTYRTTTWLCPVSDALVRSFNTYADPNHQGYKTGLLNFMPELASKIRVIPSKIDHEFWNFKPFTYRNDILALAYVYDPRTYILKGFDIIVACAQMMPEYKFTLAIAANMIGLALFHLRNCHLSLILNADMFLRQTTKLCPVIILITLATGLHNPTELTGFMKCWRKKNCWGPKIFRQCTAM